MEFRCWQHSLAFVSTLFILLPAPQGAPIFKIKHYSYFKPKEASPPLRTERRLVGGSSPIHFISPFLSSKLLDRFEDVFVPVSMQVKPRSSIFKLPLQLLANGKPHSVVKGFPSSKHPQDLLPQGSSNIIKVPLKFVTNGKPVRIFFQDRFHNHL